MHCRAELDSTAISDFVYASTMVTGHWTLYLRTPTCIANKDRHESNHPCYSRTFLLEFGVPAETQNKKVEAGVVVLRKLSLQVGRGLLPVILTVVVTALCASAAAQTNCNPPCGGQGPFRLFIGPAASTVPLGNPQYFWAIANGARPIHRLPLLIPPPVLSQPTIQA